METNEKAESVSAAPVLAEPVAAAPDSTASRPAVSGSMGSAQKAGAPIPAKQASPIPPAAPQPVPAAAVTEEGFVPSNKSKYEPISTKGYIGIWLLMMIPVVNLLLLIVWACGGCRKINKRNFARSMLIVGAVSMVIGGIMAFVFRSAWSDYAIPFASSYGSYSIES